MAANQHFRSAFRGFNREDVVHYIDYLNNFYSTQLEQLKAQLSNVQPADPDLLARLKRAEARCAELETQLAAKQADTVAVVNSTGDELEAYRRAERTERQARERAQQIYTQANAVLAEVTLKAEAASAQVADVANQVTAQLQGTKNALEDAVATLYAILPES